MKRIIKKTVFISIAFVAGLFLYSCYFTGVGGRGSIALRFSEVSPKSARAASSTTYARVYLIANGEIYPIGDGTDYVETSLSGTSATEVEIPDVPVGPQYQVTISIGDKPTVDADFLEVTEYGASDPFSITPGGTTDVSLTPTASPFSLYLGGTELKGVIYNTADSTLYVVSGTRLYMGASVSGMDTGTLLPTGYSANSISLGTFFGGAAPKDEPWIDTNMGILPYRNGAFQEDFFSGTISSGTKPSILQSGGVWVNSNVDLTVFYQRDGGLGGTYIASDNASTPSNWNWLDIDLSDVLTGRPILDFFVTANYAYFATKLGAFRLDTKMIQDYSVNTSNVPDLMSYADFFKVTDSNGNEIPIISLGYDNGTKIVMGTEAGAYMAELDEASADTPLKAGTISLLEGTGDYEITRVSVSPDGAYIALFSEKDLFVYRQSTGTIVKLPFYSGLPGEITGAAWMPDNKTLVITGEDGMVSVDVTGLGL